jgi:hypothetical protein
MGKPLPVSAYQPTTKGLTPSPLPKRDRILFDRSVRVA